MRPSEDVVVDGGRGRGGDRVCCALTGGVGGALPASRDLILESSTSMCSRLPFTVSVMEFCLARRCSSWAIIFVAILARAPSLIPCITPVSSFNLASSRSFCFSRRDSIASLRASASCRNLAALGGAFVGPTTMEMESSSRMTELFDMGHSRGKSVMGVEGSVTKKTFVDRPTISKIGSRRSIDDYTGLHRRSCPTTPRYTGVVRHVFFL